MPVAPNDLSSRLMLGLLAALIFIVAPSGQTYAQTRALQATLYAEGDNAPGVDTDIPMFHDGWPQPNGPSILIRFDTTKPFQLGQYEWSRIVAVYFDEPYRDFVGVQCWDVRTVKAVEGLAQRLAERAAELKSVAPLTRFWVNLTHHQLDWVMTRQCVYDFDEDVVPVNVNRPYIDVISVDIYHTWFDQGVKRYYDWLDTHRAKPDQQMALVPGTFYRQGKDNPSIQASYLYGYFDYANNANQNCNLPLGSRGVTGYFDGCRIWMVMGWLAFNWTEYKGLRDPTSAPIADVWKNQLALPLRPDLARQRTPGEILPAFLPVLLE